MSHSDLILQIKDILLPLVTSESDREALLIDAFYLSDSRLFYGIDRKGAAPVFTSLLIKKLIDHSSHVEGRRPLAHLLHTARHHYGNDKGLEIDELISRSDELGQPTTNPITSPARSISHAPILTIDTPRDERRPTVFISYYHGDAEDAQKLIAELNRAGHACWIDTSAIKGGDEWVLTIADGIINSYALIPLITSKALQSKWVQKEILWAQQRKKLIIPWIIEDVMHEPGFFSLVDYHGVTLFDRGFDAALQMLLRSLPAIEAAEAPLNETISITQMHNTPRKLELGYLERLRLEDLLNTDKYTPMAGTYQQKIRPAEMRAVFELMKFGKDRERQHETRRFENAVEEILHIRRAVLLGEPGGGKTTTIWKLAADLVENALQDRKTPIPLLIRLGRWTDPDQPLEEFMASQLGDLGSQLNQMLSEERATLLFDGLNELPAGQRHEKYPQVQRFIEQNPKLIAVVSCRELDYTIDLGFDLINITPLDPIRIREFAGRYLGAELGEKLFWRLAGGDEVQVLWSVWQKAGSSFELFWTATEIPKENPNVYSATTGPQDDLWRDKVRGKHSLMELARNPYMLLMLTSVYAEQGELPENRGELFQLFVETLLKREHVPESEQKLLTEGLARIAYEMQIRRTSTAEDDQEHGDARTVLSRDEAGAILDERLLYLAGSASILSVGEQVRFTHQLLQEYFAARCMDIKIRSEHLEVTDIWLSARWWHRTNWEEAAVLLAGLYSDDCSLVVDWVAQGNPEVAAQCITRSGALLSDATRERLRSEWIYRLTDLQNDPQPQSRAAIGRALAITGWDDRKGVGTVRDANGVMLPDIDWVEIPGGEFQYGHKDEDDSPPRKITLPTFYISRYPVTYAQFQTFVDDSEGYTNPEWFEGLAADDDARQMQEQYFKFSNHPRETVNWYQAIAFCRWLSQRLGGGYDLKKINEWTVRLPTEFEWEKAARGTNGRLYPYEGDFDVAKDNTDETGIRQTSAVGIFPNGASPYGVMDMSGNVWEWCLSNYEKPALEARKENLRTDKTRVLRGGSWYNVQVGARAVYRNRYFPDSRRGNLGFRVVVVARPPS